MDSKQLAYENKTNPQINPPACLFSFKQHFHKQNVPELKDSYTF